MNRLLVALAALVGLLVIALLVGPRLVDWNRFKPEMAALVEEATGRPLAIEGDVRLSVLPVPTLSASGLRLGGPAAGTAAADLVRLRALDARIAFRPLLTGRIVIDSIALVEPEIELSAGNGLEAGWRAGLGDRLSVERMLVVDGRLHWADGDADLLVERINAEITATTLSGPFRISGDATWRGLPWRYDLSTGRLGEREAAPVALSLGLRGGGGNLRLSGTATPGAETLLAGRLRADATRLPELLGAAGFGGPLPAPLGQPLTLEGTLQLGRSRLALNDVALTLGDDLRAGGAAGLTLQPRGALDVTLAINRIDLDRWTTPLPAAAPARPGGAPPVAAALDLTIDALLWRGAVIRQARLGGVLDATGLTVRQAVAQLPGGSDVALFGRLSLDGAPRFDGQLEGGADNLRSILDWLKLDVSAVPADRLRRVSVTTGLSVAADAVELANLDLRFDASRLTGGLVVALGARPAFGANLAFDRLNLEAYLPPPARWVGPPGAAPLAWLGGFDANLQIQVEQLAFDALPVRRARLDASLEQGVLTVREAAADSLAGARFRAQGTLRRARWPAELELAASLDAADPAPLLTLLGLAGATPALGPLAASLSGAGPLDALQVGLEARLAGGDGQAGGRLALAGAAPGFEGHLSWRHPEALQLGQLLAPGWRPAADAIGGVTLEAELRADLDGGELTDLALKLGPTALAGRVGLALGAARPRVTAALSAPALVLDPLLPRRWETPPDGALGADLWSLLAALPEGLGGLPALDVEATLALGALDYRADGLRDVAVTMALADRVLRVPRLVAGWQGGRIGLTGQVDGGLALELTGEDLPLGRAAAALLGLPGLDGRGGVAVSLGAGPGPRDVTGSGRVEGRMLLLPGFDLAGLAARLADPPAGGDAARLIGPELAGGRSLFDRLAAGFTVAGPVIGLETARLDGAAGSVEATGRLDLAAPSLALDLTVRPLAGPVGDPAPAAVLRFTGPPDRPERSVDSAALAAWLAARVPPPAPSTPVVAPPVAPPPPGPAASGRAGPAPRAGSGGR